MAGLTMALLCAVSHRANAAEIKVLASGRFRAAYLQLVPGFERVSGHKVVSTWGGSMGSAPTTILNRMQRGEVCDAVFWPETDWMIWCGRARLSRVAGSISRVR